MGLIVSHKRDAEGKEKTILRRDTGQILHLEANIKLARTVTFLIFFLLTAVPMFNFNHQSVSQFRDQNTWNSFEAHGYVHFFLIHSPK